MIFLINLQVRFILAETERSVTFHNILIIICIEYYAHFQGNFRFLSSICELFFVLHVRDICVFSE